MRTVLLSKVKPSCSKFLRAAAALRLCTFRPTAANHTLRQ